MSDDDIELSRQDYVKIIENKKKPLFVKFTADWCGPCQRAKPTIDAWLCRDDVRDKIEYLEIDIDNSIDVFAYMKKMKMLNGIPSLFFYEMKNTTFAPSLSTSTGNVETIQKFLDTVKQFI